MDVGSSECHHAPRKFLRHERLSVALALAGEFAFFWELVVEQVIVVPNISFESVVPVRSALRESRVVEELVEAPKWCTGFASTGSGKCEELHEAWCQDQEVLLVP